jgi:hypothetical protein
MLEDRGENPKGPEGKKTKERELTFDEVLATSPLFKEERAKIGLEALKKKIYESAAEEVRFLNEARMSSAMPASARRKLDKMGRDAYNAAFKGSKSPKAGPKSAR